MLQYIYIIFDWFLLVQSFITQGVGVRIVSDTKSQRCSCVSHKMRKFLLALVFLVFNGLYINTYFVYVNTIMKIFINLLIWSITLIGIWMLNHLCLVRINITWIGIYFIGFSMPVFFEKYTSRFMRHSNL